MNLDQVPYDLSAVSSGESCKRLYQPREAQGGPRDGPGKPREGPREGLREARKSPGRTQDGPGRAQGRPMAQGGNEGEGKVKRRRRGKGGGGSNSGSPLAPRGGKEAFETRFFFCLEHGRRGFRSLALFWPEGGVRRLQSPPSFWPEGRGRGDARVFGLQGEGEAFSTQTPFNELWKRGGLKSPPLPGGGGWRNSLPSLGGRRKEGF